MLAVCRCVVAGLGVWQQRYAAVVAAREVLYLCSTLLATWQCPVFLLMDPITAWKEAENRLEKVMRAAMYVLTPHNYTALCLACLLYTSPSPRDATLSRMPSSA